MDFLISIFSYQQIETILLYPRKHFWQKFPCTTSFSASVRSPVIIQRFLSSVVSDLVFRSGFSLMRWVCCSVSHKEVIGWWHVYHFPQKNLQQVTKYAKHFILWAQKEWCNHHLSHIPGELVTVCIDCETQLSSESSAVFIPDNRTLATY